MDLGLSGRVAVVTGAGKGIGRRVTLDLVAEGCRVLACARTQADLDAVAADAPDGRVVPLAVDLGAAGSEQRIVDAALAIDGRLDIVVNNAGGPSPRRLDRMTDADWRASFEVDFFAAVRLAVAAAAPMRAAGWGRIVNMASTYARQPDPAYAGYGAAKAALVNFTKSAAQAWSADGVLCNAVLPGVTLTEGVAATASLASEKSGRPVDEIMAATMANDPIALGRFATTDEISRVIVFVCSDAASFVSGAAWAIDGSTVRTIP